MKRKIAILVLIVATITNIAAQQTYHYVTRDDTTQLLLDLYKPDNPRPDKACVVYLFGGGFYLGERNSDFMVDGCKRLAERGFVVASIDYRLGLRQADLSKANLCNAHTFFELSAAIAVQDCSAAIAYLCAHAKEFDIDTSHIILVGNSAGAITVLQADYCRANNLPDAAEMPPTFKPMAIVPYAGGIMCHNNKLRYATPPAPTCFFHGTKDRIVNYKRMRASLTTSLFGADRLAKLFKKQGYCHWILRYDGIGHEIASIQPYTINEFVAFVDAVGQGRIMTYDAHCTDSKIVPTRWSKMTVFDIYLRPLPEE
ncbi:MAG: alpha/beta hydrolase [Bacteroidales bacterium]|nr:alpha/beta hydrolase [Bacteroidales bacterium]